MGGAGSNFQRVPKPAPKKIGNNTCTDYDEHLDLINMREEEFIPWDNYRIVSIDEYPNSQIQWFKEIPTILRKGYNSEFGIVQGLGQKLKGLSGYMVSFSIMPRIRGGIDPWRLEHIVVEPDFNKNHPTKRENVMADWYNDGFASKGISGYCSEIGEKIPGEEYEWYPAIHPGEITGLSFDKDIAKGYPWLGQPKFWIRNFVSENNLLNIKPITYFWTPANNVSQNWDASMPVYPNTDGSQLTAGAHRGKSAQLSLSKFIHRDLTSPSALAICQRRKFLADPVMCCIMDHVCSEKDNYSLNKQTCFEEEDLNLTCSPLHRNLGSVACMLRLAPYCSGDEKLNDYEYKNLWDPELTININGRLAKNICYNMVIKTIHQRPETLCKYADFVNADLRWADLRYGNIPEVRNILTNMVEHVISENDGKFFLESDEEGTGHAEFRIIKEQLLKICTQVPLLCQTILPTICSNVDKSNIGKYEDAFKFCGCFMEEEEYYNPGDLLERECFEFCVYSANNGGIPLVDQDNSPKLCTSTICIINANYIDFINVENSKTGGVINFNQVCSACGKNEVYKRYFNPTPEQKEEERKKGNVTGISVKNKVINFTSKRNLVDFIPIHNKFIDKNFELIQKINDETNKSCIISLITITVPIFRTFLNGYLVDPNTSEEYKTKIINTLELLDEERNFDIITDYKILDPGRGYLEEEEVEEDGEEEPKKLEAHIELETGILPNFVDGNVTIIFQPYIYGNFNGRDSRNENSSCVCRMDLNFQATNSKLSGINLDQNCGSIKCYDDDGQDVDCEDGEKITPYKDAIDDLTKTKKDNQFNEMFIFIVILSSVLLILYFIFYSVNRYLISKLKKAS